MGGDAFPISGAIDAAAFPFLLVSLHEHGATGSLKVDGPSYQKALYFRAGRVLFGSSNDPRDQLGSILIESGRITPEQLEEVNAKVGPGSPLAKVLADSGFVSQRELSEAARTKVELILADVMSYASGSFDFEDGVLPKGAIDLKLLTPRLFLAAARRVNERSFVLRHLGSLDIVLMPQLSEGRLDELRAECAGLLDALDGQRSLKEAIALTRLDEFDASKLACGLLFLGAIGRRRETPSPLGFSSLADGSDVALAQAAQAVFQTEMPGTSGQDSPFFLPAEPPAAPTPAPAWLPPSPPQRPTSPMDLSFVPISSEPAPVTKPSAEDFALGSPTGDVPTTILPPASMPPVPFNTPAPKSSGSTTGSTKLPLVPPPPKRAPIRPTPGPEPELTVPRPPPPSRADLAAVDALLNSRSVERPLAAPARPTPSPRAQQPAWEPHFGQPARGGPARGTALSPMLIGTIVVLLAVAGGAAWYLWLRPKPGTTPAGRSTVPGPAATGAAPTSAPTAVEPSAEATTATTASATPIPPVSPTGTPTPAPDLGSTPRSLEDARAALQRGAISEAGRGFAAALAKSPGGRATVQLLVACADETVAKAIQATPGDELFVVPVTLKGRACHRLCWGLYESSARADSAMASIPPYFREGGAKPKAITLREILH